MDSVDIVHGLSGHFPWTQWTLSMDIVHSVSGLFPPHFMSHCQNSSKFLSIAYFMKTADVIMFVFSSHDRTNHPC